MLARLCHLERSLVAPDRSNLGSNCSVTLYESTVNIPSQHALSCHRSCCHLNLYGVHLLHSIVLFAPLATLVAAKPVLGLQERNIISPLFCAAVSTVVSDLKAFSSATPFCSSFLSVPLQTATTTVTTTACVHILGPLAFPGFAKALQIVFGNNPYYHRYDYDNPPDGNGDSTFVGSAWFPVTILCKHPLMRRPVLLFQLR